MMLFYFRLNWFEVIVLMVRERESENRGRQKQWDFATGNWRFWNGLFVKICKKAGKFKTKVAQFIKSILF